ncbi:MAG: PKD domain-containing protein, partial [Syntrophobacteraceae bacterium]
MNKYLRSSIIAILLVVAAATGHANDTSYTYDQLNRLIGVEYSDGTRVEYTYDEVGNRITRSVALSSGLAANFTATPESGQVPLTVAFTDQSSGAVSSRSWSFGDGGDSTSQNPNHTYTSLGTYTAILTVSDGSVSAFARKTITVNPPPPIANFSASPTGGTIPLTVTFTDSSTGAVTGWAWTFGDGGTSTIQNPSHIFTNPGTYTVNLTVSGPGGNSDPKTASITVLPPPPVANFSATPAIGDVPLSVQFTDTSTGSITGWSWDFGDGQASTSQNPAHTYSAQGAYTVSLTVTGSGGSDTKTLTSYINISTPPPGIDQYTKLMLHFDGPNGSKTFTDSENTAKTVTGHGNAQISTAYSEFGGASLKLDASSGSYLSVPASPDWNFSGDFTIDFWWYPTSSSYNPIISIGTYSLSIAERSGVVYVWMSSNGSSWDIANQVRIGTPSGTGFDHFALVRAG